jgi:SDR family mycofactocin-dependent oxidoreductase
MVNGDVMGVLSGKVALISGAARGQGRSHAIRLAEEGANIIGFDICHQIDSVEYAMATQQDLAETSKMVECGGGRIVTVEADARDPEAVQKVVDLGLTEFGQIDIVVANAGIMPITGEQGMQRQAWIDAIDVMLSGVYYTVQAAAPSMIEKGAGGAIVITSSTAGLKGLVRDYKTAVPGLAGYIAAKHGVVGLMRMYANALAAHNIRCNTVHPTGCDTPMVMNDVFAAWKDSQEQLSHDMQNLLPVPAIEPVDVSNAIVYLCSDMGRYVTGTILPVDAGFSVR